MRDAGRRVCSLCKDFGIRVAGSVALPQIIVSSRVLQPCGKFSSFLNPPHKQKQRERDVGMFNTDPLLHPFFWPGSELAWHTFVGLETGLFIADSPSLLLHLFTIDPEVKSCTTLSHHTWLGLISIVVMCFFSPPQLTECLMFIYCSSLWQRKWREYH